MNRFLKKQKLFSVLAIIVIGLMMHVQVAHAVTVNCGAWTVVTSPGPGQDNLYSVVAVSARNVWAVGGYQTAQEVARATLVVYEGVTAPSSLIWRIGFEYQMPSMRVPDLFVMCQLKLDRAVTLGNDTTQLEKSQPTGVNAHPKQILWFPEYVVGQAGKVTSK